ncbi:MAG TPA: GAF domain-containing protein [Candidatus Binatia bacterium]|nr:GAF domain-containing protein [Candidatus Binatia bacterium]
MSMDLLLLGAGGMIALIAAGIVAILSPGGIVSLIAAGALAMLGVLEFCFARAVFDLAATGRTEWFVNSLALSLPVSALWVLLAATLGRTRGSRGIGAWRFYLLFQALLAAGVATYAFFRVDRAPEAPGEVFHLHGVDWAILAAILLNLILLAAKFEATHLSLPPRRRETFRPALLGVLGCSGLLSYLIFSMLATGRVDVGDIGASAAPASLLSFLLAASLIRGRIGEARAPEDRLPATATTSLLIAVGYVTWTAILLWLTRSAGMRLAEGLLWITVGGVVVGVTALTVSNRLRRKLDLFLDPVWFEPRAVRRMAAKGADAPLASAASLEDLCRLIPENARALADVDPVTLFLADPAERCFRAVGSTIAPGPGVVIPDREPLPMELRRARRPIRLTGRSDDLEYVGIYVENAEQIAACSAVCAVPILGDEGLMGFLLCGSRGTARQLHGEELVLLNLVSRDYAERLERLQRETARSRPL